MYRTEQWFSLAWSAPTNTNSPRPFVLIVSGIPADLKLSDADIPQSEIDVEMDTSSIDRHDEQRDAHLRSPD